jgi:DNA-binding transcriptional ArsR family regulator
MAYYTATYRDSLIALADPTRLAVFERLAKGPAAVNEIASQLPVSRPAVSQHLRVLKVANLVFDERIGTRRIYRLNPSGIEAIRTYFDRFWSDALESFKSFAETNPQSSPTDATNRAKSSRPKSDRRKR